MPLPCRTPQVRRAMETSNRLGREGIQGRVSNSCSPRLAALGTDLLMQSIDI